MLLDCAVSCLASRLGPILARSSVIESQPWGYESSNLFLNIGVNVQTSLSAPEIVKVLKGIERDVAPDDAHRDACGNYADRFIDLDLICLDNQVCNNPEAMVPHPRMCLREFVMRPLAEIWPSWVHPQLGLSASKILEELCNNSSKEYVKK